MIIDFFAALSFYFVPYLTGRFFVKKIVQAWILGAFIWFIFYFLLSWILMLVKIGDFSQIVRYAAIFVSAISVLTIFIDFILGRTKIRLSLDLLAYIPILALGTFLYFFVWKRNTPYPLQLNWDIYEHITLANIISTGKLSFIASNISDTFTLNTYAPFFEILLSLPKIIFQRSLLGIYWWLEYGFYLATIIASFVLAKKFFQNAWIGVSCAIVSIFVFESLIVYSPLFLIPQTLVALLTVLILKDIKEHRFWLLILSGLAIFLMHYVVGVLALLVLTAGYIFSRYQPSNKILNLTIFISGLATIALFVLNLIGKWEVLGIEEAAHFNFTLTDKMGFLLNWYGAGLFIFFAIGTVGIIRKGDLWQKLILILGILILGISFTPFSYFLKFFTLGSYFVGMIIGFGIFILLANMKITWRIVSLAWISLVLLVTFYKNQLIFKEPLYFKNLVTQISPKEIEAGNWLSKQPKNAILVSDPSLQYILEATSGVNTQGGVYANISTRRILSGIKDSRDTNFIKNELLKIKDKIPSEQRSNKRTLFAVGGRYFAWQMLSEREKKSSFYNIWSPRLVSEEGNNYINFLMQNPQFRLLFRNDEIAIFEIV